MGKSSENNGYHLLLDRNVNMISSNNPFVEWHVGFTLVPLNNFFLTRMHKISLIGFSFSLKWIADISNGQNE